MDKYNYLKGAKKGVPSAVGAALAVKLGGKLGFDPVMSVAAGAWITNYIWDFLKRTVIKKYFSKK